MVIMPSGPQDTTSQMATIPIIQAGAFEDAEGHVGSPSRIPSLLFEADLHCSRTSRDTATHCSLFIRMIRADEGARCQAYAETAFCFLGEMGRLRTNLLATKRTCAFFTS